MAQQASTAREASPSFTMGAKAVAHVTSLRDEQDGAGGLAFWIEVLGARGPDFAYDLYFQAADEAGADDLVLTVGDEPEGESLIVVIPAESVALLDGAHLDMSRDLLAPGLKLENPNQPPAPPGPPPAASPEISGSAGDLSGDTAQRVTQVLERQINPSIAGHGGRADLVAIEDDVAYLRLSGGCQGCGMASVTLGQGIVVTILDNVPEITSVVDVTDHASGTNPYYEEQKK